MFSLCHPWFTTTNFSYTFPILETSATASCGSTGIFKRTTWKVDGPTPMYWFIMAPYKSPPFGSGDRHLLSHRYPGSAPHSWRGGVIPWHPWHLWICNNNWRIGGKHIENTFFSVFSWSWKVLQCFRDVWLIALWIVFLLVLNIY